MSRVKSIYHCQQCGYQSPKWLGRCPECNSWNSLVEEAGVDEPRWRGDGETVREATKYGEIQPVAEERLLTGIGEFDRVLGGGLVRGSVILIGGDPGIGKSTLLLASSWRLTRYGKVLYASGEESLPQIKLRGKRVGITGEGLYLLSETSLEAVLAAAGKIGPAAVVIDSVQTFYSSRLQSPQGSVSQIREVAAEMMTYSKKTGIPSLLVGHVTKEGAIAGPRVLEHIVDAVLYFEGDKGHSFRILRSVKNRFGSTHEIGVFEMREEGLVEVSNPSELFLSGRSQDAPGSVVVSSLEGSRPVLVEMQALVTPGYLGVPRRVANGIDSSRVALLLAILDKRGGLHLQGEDIYINVVGGIFLQEPAVDLGLVVAVASSFKDRKVDAGTLILGEVGLAGEIRAVSEVPKRLKEAAKLGFQKAVVPADNIPGLTKPYPLDLLPVRTVEEVIRSLFP